MKLRDSEKYGRNFDVGVVRIVENVEKSLAYQLRVCFACMPDWLALEAVILCETLEVVIDSGK